MSIYSLMLQDSSNERSDLDSFAQTIRNKWNAAVDVNGHYLRITAEQADVVQMREHFATKCTIELAIRLRPAQ